MFCWNFVPHFREALLSPTEVDSPTTLLFGHNRRRYLEQPSKGQIGAQAYFHMQPSKPAHRNYYSLAYSAFACSRIGRSGSASFQIVRKS
jgi:hypothetical protein